MLDGRQRACNCSQISSRPVKVELVFWGTSKYLLRNGEGGEGRGSVVLFQPAACSGSIADSEHGPLTAVVVSVPDLYLTLSIHPEAPT